MRTAKYNTFLRTIKKLYILLAFVSVFLSGCSNESDDFDSDDFTIKGYVVTSPENVPISDVLVRVTNDNYTLAATSSNANGSFTITVNRSELDNSYYLSIFDPKTEISKQIDITGVGLSEYNFGNISLYDSRNPYELPTFEYNGYTYVAHPVLRDKSKYELAQDICETLNDFGISSWFLPSENELLEFFRTRNIYELPQYPNGSYCITDLSLHVYKSSEGFGTWPNGGNYEEAYVLPMSRFK